MPEKAKINFYEIQKCGYYRHGNPELIFGNISLTMSQLVAWAKRPNFSLESTCTFAINEDDNDGLRAFCFDIFKNDENGDFFLTTWNETPSNKGNVPSVSGGQPVGNAQVHLNSIQAGTIPGYATYFWIIPDLNVFATIKFHHALNGQKNLIKYINGFLERHSPNAVLNQIDDDNIEITGYRENAISEILSLVPSFRTKLLRKTGEIELIRQRRQEIRKVIRKSLLDLDLAEERSLFQRMLQKIGLNLNNEYQDGSLRVDYSFPYNPTEEGINSIIDHAIEEGLSWTNDIGFQMKGESETYWLSNSIVKHDFDLNIQRDNDEIVNLNSLATQLSENRPLILNIVGAAL